MHFWRPILGPITTALLMVPAVPATADEVYFDPGPPPSAAPETTDQPVMPEAKDFPVLASSIVVSVAAGKGVDVTASMVTDALGGARQIILKSDFPAKGGLNGYPADVGCTGVSFALAGGQIILNDKLPTTYTTDSKTEGRPAFTSVVKAKAYVVNQVNCAGKVGALGCGGEGKAMFIAAHAVDNRIVWAHEAGHTKGLGHADPYPIGECPESSSGVPDKWKKRIMYCAAATTALGLTATECKSLGGTPDLPVIAAVDGPAPIPGVAANGGDADEAPPAGPPSLDELIFSPKLSNGRYRPDLLGLSPEAIEIVRDIVSKAADTDRLKGAVEILGAVGSQEDAARLVALADNSTLSTDPGILAARAIAPESIAAIGGRQNLPEVLAAAAKYLSFTEAAGKAGPGWASAYQSSAAFGLASTDPGREVLYGAKAYAEAANMAKASGVVASACNILEPSDVVTMDVQNEVAIQRFTCSATGGDMAVTNALENLSDFNIDVIDTALTTRAGLGPDPASDVPQQ